MSGERVVVTGGSGFIGSHLVDRLLARGDDVIVFDRTLSRNLDDAAKHPRFRFVQGDVRDPASVTSVLSSEGVRAVYHLSAVVGVERYCEDPLEVIDVNVGGTRNVLGAALARNLRVLFASTSEVLGKNPKVPWAEDDDRVVGSTAVDRWSYSTSKAAGEHMVLGMHRTAGLAASIVRFFNVYGPRQSPSFVVSRSVYRVLRRERPMLYDAGDQTRCFTFVDDAIEATLRAAEHADAVGRVFHVGNPRETTMRSVVETVLRVAGSSLTAEPVDTRARFGSTYEDIARRVPDVRRARDVLGWEATTSLEEGIARTVAWAQKNAWWLA